MWFVLAYTENRLSPLQVLLGKFKFQTLSKRLKINLNINVKLRPTLTCSAVEDFGRDARVTQIPRGKAVRGSDSGSGHH